MRGLTLDFETLPHKAGVEISSRTCFFKLVYPIFFYQCNPYTTFHIHTEALTYSTPDLELTGQAVMLEDGQLLVNRYLLLVKPRQILYPAFYRQDQTYD